MLINSQTHTNDANFEFPYLIDGSNNIKVLSQENVIELIVNNGFIPDDIKDQIETYDFQSLDYEQEIKNIIFSKNSEKINYLFNTRLKIDTTVLSDNIKKLLINFIFYKWEEDRSWSGTVLPMKWLNIYFDFIQDDQFDKLFSVFEEYSSSYHSHEAYYDTCDVVRKIKPNHIKSFENSFVELVANRSLSYNLKDYPLLFEKLDEYIESNLLNDDYKGICNSIKEKNKILTILKTKKDIENRGELVKQLEKRKKEIYKFLDLE